MLASVLENKLNGIRQELNENIFELNREKLLSNIEHEEIELNCKDYSKDQIINFAEPIAEFTKIKSLSNFACLKSKVFW